MTSPLEVRCLAAERTVEVLKRQVRSLYDEGAHTAVHRQLDAIHRREQKNLRRQAVMRARTEELQRHSVHLEQQVADRTRDIRTIVDNVTFGFVVVDRELRVRPGFTRSCTTLFGKPLEAGGSLLDALNISGTVAADTLMLAMSEVFEDFMCEEITLYQLPNRFVVGDRVLRVEGGTVRTDTGTVEAVLLTISDISDLEAVQTENRRNASLLRIVGRRRAFRAFLRDTRQLLATARENLHDQVLVRRAVHTVKGNASIFGLDHVVAVAHAVENEQTLAIAGLDDLEGTLRQFLHAHRDLLGLDYERDVPRVVLDANSLDDLIERVEGCTVEASVRSWVAQATYTPVGELLEPLGDLVERLGAQMGKEVLFVLEGGHVPVDGEALRPVLRSLPHLIRNALDHGLDRSGRVTVRTTDDGINWRFAIEDDGRGLDTTALRQRAIQLGHLDQQAADELDEARALDLVFVDGLSTREVVTGVSGRGVGMPALRAAVESLQGEIHLHSRPGYGTRVEIAVPKPTI